MTELYVITPGTPSLQLSEMIRAATEGLNTTHISSSKDLPDLNNKKLIFAVELNQAGYNIPLLEILSTLWERGENALAGSSAGILLRSPCELYTKDTAQNIIFTANQLGCRFPGHPVLEATGNLENFRTWQKTLDMSLEEICLHLCKKLGSNLIKDSPRLIEKPKILVLHASSHKTSNTLELWQMASKYLLDYEVQEVHVENGTITDCKGCSFTTCLHFGKNNSCFYGGEIVQEILPAIEKADAVVWICPNYNDTLSAKLMAVVNRMTVLYRRVPLYHKTLFAIIVSGSSGSDSVAKQLLGALNINKGFRLPPYFVLHATANDPGAIHQVADIEERARKFAENLRREIKA